MIVFGGVYTLHGCTYRKINVSGVPRYRCMSYASIFISNRHVNMYLQSDKSCDMHEKEASIIHPKAIKHDQKSKQISCELKHATQRERRAQFLLVNKQLECCFPRSPKLKEEKDL